MGGKGGAWGRRAEVNLGPEWLGIIRGQRIPTRSGIMRGTEDSGEVGYYDGLRTGHPVWGRSRCVAPTQSRRPEGGTGRREGPAAKGRVRKRAGGRDPGRGSGWGTDGPGSEGEVGGGNGKEVTNQEVGRRGTERERMEEEPDTLPVPGSPLSHGGLPLSGQRRGFLTDELDRGTFGRVGRNEWWRAPGCRLTTVSRQTHSFLGKSRSPL